MAATAGLGPAKRRLSIIPSVFRMDRDPCLGGAADFSQQHPGTFLLISYNSQGINSILSLSHKLSVSNKMGVQNAAALSAMKTNPKVSIRHAFRRRNAS